MLRWFPNAIYGSTPAEFESDYSIEESVQRLAAATKRSAWSALFRQAAVGKVTAQRVSLVRVMSLVSNSYKPFFWGAFEQTGDQVRLIGRFTLHPFVKLFHPILFGFCALWTVLALLWSSAQPAANWWVPFIGVGFILWSVIVLLVGRWFARNDVAWLSRVIQDALSEPEVWESVT